MCWFGFIAIIMGLAAEPCRSTFPALESLARERHDIPIIGVSGEDARADAESTIRKCGLPFGVLHDSEHWIGGASA